MDEEPDVIRQRIDATRESLTDKLETLEEHVKEAVGTVTETIETVKTTVQNTVETVKSGVEDTVETVKSSLSDTVDTVKETFDLSRQVDRHPWGAVGCSLLAGVATGYLLSGRHHGPASFKQGIPRMNRLIPGYEPSRPIETQRHEEHEATSYSSLLRSMVGPFEAELGKVKRTAIGALMGMARDAVKQALPPSLESNVKEIFDSVTQRLGGEPVHGSVLEPDNTEHASQARNAAACHDVL